MPPKPKFTKEQIVSAALDIVADRGIDGLTSRELGNALGSSARPIFTIFKNMDEVVEEVYEAAMCRFDEYAQKVDDTMPAFKQVGIHMLMFAVEQPELYKLLFMNEKSGKKNFSDTFNATGKTASICVEFIMRDYELEYDEALKLFRHLWIYTYGLGTLIATRVYRFKESEMSEMLTCEFTGILRFIKSEQCEDGAK